MKQQIDHSNAVNNAAIVNGVSSWLTNNVEIDWLPDDIRRARNSVDPFLPQPAGLVPVGSAPDSGLVKSRTGQPNLTNASGSPGKVSLIWESSLVWRRSLLITMIPWYSTGRNCKAVFFFDVLS